jgi:integrase
VSVSVLRRVAKPDLSEQRQKTILEIEMATLSREKGRNSWKLSWRESDGKRRSIRLGAVPKKTAEQFRTKFEELLGIRRAGGVVSAALNEWIQALDPELRTKLEHHAFVESQRRLSLGKFCEEFRQSRVSVAPATKTRDRQVCDLLIERFGADRELASITVRNAEEWQQWLANSGNKRDNSRASLGANTVRRRTGVARQIFATAIRWKFLQENPFRGLATSVRENKERQQFVSWDTIKLVIAEAPTLEWRALIAFCRLVGPRVPSELADLRWSDIDFVTRRIVLRSPKTKHHGGEHAMRCSPMYPELVPYLQELAEQVGPGVVVPLSSLVFPLVSDAAVNLRTSLRRFIVKAGVQVWPKLFHNLRSSRETELLAKYSIADVCNWFGHSPTVAARFYAQARTEVLERASVESTLPGAPAGARPAEKDVFDTKAGANAGAITDRQNGLRATVWRGENQQKEPSEDSPDGSCEDADGNHQWAKRDSNPRHPLCKSGALTN